jgi:multiple sugar transport system permease protein
MIVAQSTPRSRTGTLKTSLPNKLGNQIHAYLFLLPALLIFAVFSWYPIITTVLYSFQKVGLRGPTGWAGINNYVRMFTNPAFPIAWLNVLEFVLLTIIFGFMVPIFLALMINEMRRFGTLFQVITYIPTLIPIAVALLVWRLIYAPEGGALNSILKIVHLPQQLWLQDPHFVKFSLVLIMTWLGAGGSILIYLAALKEINPEIYEAAELDGVSPWKRIYYLTLPLLKSRMAIMLILQIIAVSQVFTEPFILTTGGPGNSTLTPVLQIYRTAFENSDFGLASAWSVSLLVVLGTFSILYVWLTRKSDADRLN